jgi:hypothetical protein
MSVSRHRSGRRPKLFGRDHGTPLDRNAKYRIYAYACAYTTRMRRPGQHWGPLTRATMGVLEALLWGFHNAKSGQCFPSYCRIASAARCHPDTVAKAVAALEAAGVLTWINRLARVQQQGRFRVIRTSNAYTFRDPQQRTMTPRSTESENPKGTKAQELLYTSDDGGDGAYDGLGIEIRSALERLRATMSARFKMQPT